jgi:hypothetical protein
MQTAQARRSRRGWQPRPFSVRVSGRNGPRDWRAWSPAQKLEYLLGMTLDDMHDILAWSPNELDPYRLGVLAQVALTILKIGVKAGLHEKGWLFGLEFINPIPKILGHPSLMIIKIQFTDKHRIVIGNVRLKAPIPNLSRISCCQNVAICGVSVPRDCFIKSLLKSRPIRSNAKFKSDVKKFLVLGIFVWLFRVAS